MQFPNHEVDFTQHFQTMSECRAINPTDKSNCNNFYLLIFHMGPAWLTRTSRLSYINMSLLCTFSIWSSRYHWRSCRYQCCPWLIVKFTSLHMQETDKCLYWKYHVPVWIWIFTFLGTLEIPNGPIDTGFVEAPDDPPKRELLCRGNGCNK